MAIPSLFNTGQSGLIASKAAIATTGHNITNANTEGYSRQRVLTEAADPKGGKLGHNTIGTGTRIARIERINDEYIEKQIRNANKDLSFCEEKDLALRQVEDIFNEMNGDGLNRLISRFFNEFRKLSDEPESTAVRQSVREATQAVVNDFRRLRHEIEQVRAHLDSRIEGFCNELNMLAKEVAGLNQKIISNESVRGSPNDLLDKRDLAMKRLASIADVTMYKDKNGSYNVDLKGIGPLVTGIDTETLSVERSPADANGKPEGGLDIRASSNANGIVTHSIKGGKLGALLEARDRTVSTIMDRLDGMAYTLSDAVNRVHRQGVTSTGATNVPFFKDLTQKERAAEFISLSDDVHASINNIATGLVPDAPGDNRVAIAISRIQAEKILNDGHATFDEWYNSIVSDVGVATARNRFTLNQQKDITTQLNKVRDQISGVSIDEETTNLLQFQHAFDASAKIIQAADDMLRTVLALKRD